MAAARIVGGTAAVVQGSLHGVTDRRETPVTRKRAGTDPIPTTVVPHRACARWSAAKVGRFGA